jgi:hypothetical protein
MGTLADRIGTSYARGAVRPQDEGGRTMFYRHRVHELDGSDAGEAHDAVMIQPGETIVLGTGRRVRIVMRAVPVTSDTRGGLVEPKTGVRLD